MSNPLKEFDFNTNLYLFIYINILNNLKQNKRDSFFKKLSPIYKLILIYYLKVILLQAY